MLLFNVIYTPPHTHTHTHNLNEFSVRSRTTSVSMLHECDKISDLAAVFTSDRSPQRNTEKDCFKC